MKSPEDAPEGIARTATHAHAARTRRRIRCIKLPSATTTSFLDLDQARGPLVVASLTTKPRGTLATWLKDSVRVAGAPDGVLLRRPQTVWDMFWCQARRHVRRRRIRPCRRRPARSGSSPGRAALPSRRTSSSPRSSCRSRQTARCSSATPSSRSTRTCAGRMNDVKSYVPPFALGEPLSGRRGRAGRRLPQRRVARGHVGRSTTSAGARPRSSDGRGMRRVDPASRPSRRRSACSGCRGSPRTSGSSTSAPSRKGRPSSSPARPARSGASRPSWRGCAAPG